MPERFFNPVSLAELRYVDLGLRSESYMEGAFRADQACQLQGNRPWLTNHLWLLVHVVSWSFSICTCLYLLYLILCIHNCIFYESIITLFFFLIAPRAVFSRGFGYSDGAGHKGPDQQRENTARGLMLRGSLGRRSWQDSQAFADLSAPIDHCDVPHWNLPLISFWSNTVSCECM